MIKKFLCPHCFDFIDLTEVHWRCVNPNCRKPESNEPPGEPDEILANFQREFMSLSTPPRLLHTFPSPPASALATFLRLGKVRKTMDCDWCGRPSPQRLCPRCHSDLPYCADTIENHIIAVIGPKAVGKTHYIAVLVDQLRNQVGADFSLSLLALNDSTMTRYQNEYYQPLYQGKRLLQVSQVTDYSPLMYRLQVGSNGGPFGRRKAVSLVFFDTAGENFDSDAHMNARTRYLIHASAIILLVDPLQMKGVRDQLAGAGGELPEEYTEPEQIMDRVIRLFHQFGSGSGAIRVPIAVSFTKSDVLRDYGILPDGNAVYNQSRHQGELNGIVFRQIHDEIQSWLDKWAGPQLNTQLSQYFKDYAFCCLSSLGEGPDESGRLSTVSPFRVEDPFLWALHRLGFLNMSSPKEN